VCSTCADRPAINGFEYRSKVMIGSWPLVHVCLGVDSVTLRPKVAKGVVAIGNVAIGCLAFGGLSFGLVTLGGLSIGLLGAIGGVSLGVGFSVGGVAVGSIAIGGLTVGFAHAIGGLALGPSIIDGRRCDADAAEFLRQWFGPGSLPRNCR